MSTGTLPIEEIQAKIEEISVDQAQDELARGDVVLVDVREPHEYEEAHLADAVLVPQGEVLARASEISQCRPTNWAITSPVFSMVMV